MSDFKVPLTTIKAINPHPGADRLEVATVYGFQVVIQKDRYKVGDECVYIPIDSILPQWLENALFPADSKIKLNKHRVRQIRIRGLASQGMIVDPVVTFNAEDDTIYPLEMDLQYYLEITKYEPPVVNAPQVQGARKNKKKKDDHPLFHKYNGLDNIKWFPDLFVEGEEVVIQEKMHGTNARASILPYRTNTLWKKLLKFLRLAPSVEKHYGSNNVDISSATEYKGYYGGDIYGDCFKRLDVFSKLNEGEIVFGEIIGPSIQKGYEYSLKEHQFLVFDVKVLQPDGKFKWLTPGQVMAFCAVRDFKLVPWLYFGPYNKQDAYELTKGPSHFDPATKVREGIVIKAVNGYDVEGNKRALKWVSEDYLDDATNTDNH